MRGEQRIAQAVGFWKHAACLVVNSESEVQAAFISDVVDHLEHVLPQASAQLHEVSHTLRAWAGTLCS